MDYMDLLGRVPHSPRHIPTTSGARSQKMNDVVAVLLDPFFFLSDAQHELSKRGLTSSGSKDDLLCRLFEALKTEYAEGWTLGYLLDTKILLPSTGEFDPWRLIGHHVAGYRCEGAGVIILELSDGEDLTILSIKSSDSCSQIKLDHDLFWALHTLQGMHIVARNLAQKPLLIADAAAGVRKDRWGKEAGTVFGLKLTGMREMSFFFLGAPVSVREDRICGDVWLARNDVLREDLSVLHGGDEMVGDAVKKEMGVRGDEDEGLVEDSRGVRGDGSLAVTVLPETTRK